MSLEQIDSTLADESEEANYTSADKGGAAAVEMPAVAIAYLDHVTDSSNVVEVVDATPNPSPLSPFRKGDRVVTPKGEGEVLYFNEAWGEYNIAFDTFTDYFKSCEIKRCPLPNSGKREG